MKNFRNDILSAKSYGLFLLFKQFLPITIIALLIVGLVCGFYVYKTNYEQNEETSHLADEELSQLLQKRAELHATEGAPKFEVSDALKNEYEMMDEIETEPEGYIIFSGVLKGEDLRRIQSYSLSFDAEDSGSHIHPFFEGALPFSGFVEYENNDNPNTFWIATGNLEGVSDPYDDNMRFQRVNLEDYSLTPFESVNGFYERNATYSASKNRIAYMRLKTSLESYNDLVPLENYEIVVSDIETDTIQYIFSGATQPNWFPDGNKIVYFKKGGLYAFDFLSETETFLVPVEKDEVRGISMLDMSSDGKYILWTTAKSGMISLFHIDSSQESIKAVPVDRITNIDTEYYWPIFSPDNRYYAVQAIDVLKEGDEERKNPRLEIRSVRNQEIISEYSLEAFNFNALFNDDWVLRLPNE